MLGELPAMSSQISVHAPDYNGTPYRARLYHWTRPETSAARKYAGDDYYELTVTSGEVTVTFFGSLDQLRPILTPPATIDLWAV